MIEDEKKYGKQNKIINYELNPPVYPEQEWGTKVLLISVAGQSSEVNACL